MPTKLLNILDYLTNTYRPLSILIFGSYIDGTATDESDMDLLVITENGDILKDESIVDGVQLDCDIYPKDYITTIFELLKKNVLERTEFLKIHDAVLAIDNGLGQMLKDEVNGYLERTKVTPESQKAALRNWTKKTIKKLPLNTDDSNFRASLLLWESLPNYFLLRDLIYYGSKKAIAYIKENDAEGYEILHAALSSRSLDDIRRWAMYVIE